MSCAQTACGMELDQCNNFMGLDCADSGDCGGDPDAMCAVDVRGDRYCTKPCGQPANCPLEFTCGQMTTDDNRSVHACVRPAE